MLVNVRIVRDRTEEGHEDNAVRLAPTAGCASVEPLNLIDESFCFRP